MAFTQNQDFRSSGKRFISFDEFVEFLSRWNAAYNADKYATPPLGVSFCLEFGIKDDVELNLPNTHTHQAVRIIISRYTEEK